MAEASKVLVAGAGIAGLALVRALHRRDIPCLAIERRAEAQDAGLAINLPGNAVAALHRLGLGEVLEACGSPVRRREYRTERGRLLFAVDEAAFWGPDVTPRCLRRGDLTALLAHGLPASAIRRGASVASVTGGAGEIVVGMEDGQRIHGRLLVGADGVRSTVRRLRFGEVASRAARLASASWRFMAPNPGVACWTVWASAEATILLIPVDRDTVYGWVAATRAAAEAADPEILRDLLGDFPGPVREATAAALSAPERMHHSPLDEIRMPEWSQDGVVLIGDAAHATAPVWAQGAALALEDALVLADLIATHADLSRVARDYERLRRPPVTHVQAMTDRMSRAARLPVRLRNFVMPIVGPGSYRATYGPMRASLPFAAAGSMKAGPR